MSLLTLIILSVAVLFAYRPDLRNQVLGGLFARVSVRIGAGKVEVTRGRLPAGVLEDLRFMAEDDPKLSGRVYILGRGSELRIQVKGLPEGPAQRVRNVLNLRRRDL